MKKNNFCPKTLSEKHLFEDNAIILGYKHPKSNPDIGIPIYGRKCVACGMIDDRKSAR